MIYTFNTINEQKNSSILFGHLKMGGKNPEGDEINVNNRYLTLNGEPVIPVMGEFHFSRYPREYWEEELLKMKSGGIQIVATYVFWIHHEEIEGQFEWSNNKDLRYFIQLCKKLGLFSIVRMGPWCHGECRNGGFPDWILAKSNLRTNDPDYLHYVRIYYKEIAEQLQGLLYKDGGPIIGIQLENELQKNPEHLLKLKEIAKDIGMEVPLYTVTGWGGNGGADIPEDEVLPLFGMYADHPWAGHIKDLDLSYKYFFHHIRNDLSIGADILGNDDSQRAYNPPNTERYPFATCELGPGVQVTYHRRPVIKPKDVASLNLIKLGSGNNLVGYYVFHGGSNPIGKLTTMQESKETGYPNDVPVISYDFQAPLGEFGQIREHYKLLKCQHLFLKDFGKDLAPMVSILPELRPENSSDVETVRCAVRVIDDKGFMFFNNYQRHTDMPEKENIKVQLQLQNEVLSFPQKSFSLKKDAFFFLPFNMDLDGVLLKYGTVQPLCKIQNKDESVYFFFEPEGLEAEYAFDLNTISEIGLQDGIEAQGDNYQLICKLKPGYKCSFSFKTPKGRKIRIVTLTKEQAEHTWKGKFLGEERVIITEANVIYKDNEIELFGTDNEKLSFSVFPPPGEELFFAGEALSFYKTGAFSVYTPKVLKEDIEVELKPQIENKLSSDYFKYLFTDKKTGDNSPQWEIKLPNNSLEKVKDIFLRIHYIGDVAQLYINGRMVADNFYNGISWEIGLKRFRKYLNEKKITLKLSPLKKGLPIYLEKWPQYKETEKAEVLKIEVIPEYVIFIKTKY